MDVLCQRTELSEHGIMKSRECPSKEELSQYTLGTLREESVPGLERHLDACPVCSEAIRQFESQADSFTGMLKNRQAPRESQNEVTKVLKVEMSGADYRGDATRTSRQLAAT